MELIWLFFIILFGLGVVAIIVQILFKLKDAVNHLTGYRFKHWWHINILPHKIKPSYLSVLQFQCDFYYGLSEEDKRIFEKRVQEFISMKEFVSRSRGLVVTDEMKALIAATAVTITFGLPGIYFLHFYRILIYPDNYYSTITQKYHQGEVNRAGIIVLSWANFVKGNLNAGDGRNLGLHEMAHALLLENMIVNGEYEFLDGDALRQWIQLSNDEIFKIRSGQETIFRQYGGANRHEFFAVATEIYFERPEALNNYNPHIYSTLSRLLNQDILSTGNKKRQDKPALNY